MTHDARRNWSGRSHVAIYVRSLHLLDLDLLSDWPNITEQTFTAKSNLQQRTKCVEWSLYQLFLLYHKPTAQEKLKPFFPPSTQLQSVNLRSALLRQLTALKKDGTLGQHIQLRKTMLDECKGDKFEEAIASFAIIVLKKSAQQNSFAMDFDLNSGSSLTLILAYRHSLTKNLQDRKSLQHHGLKLQDQVDKLSNDTKVQSDMVRNYETTISSNEIISLESMVRKNWLGDQQWADVILDGLLGPSYISSSITPESDSRAHTMTDEHKRLVQKLESQIIRQQGNLKDLEDMLASVKRERKEPVDQAILGNMSRVVTKARFNGHLNMKPHKSKEMTMKSSIQLNNEYQRLLDSMTEELQIDIPGIANVKTGSININAIPADDEIFLRADMQAQIKHNRTASRVEDEAPATRNGWEAYQLPVSSSSPSTGDRRRTDDRVDALVTAKASPLTSPVLEESTPVPQRFRAIPDQALFQAGSMQTPTRNAGYEEINASDMDKLTSEIFSVHQPQYFGHAEVQNGPRVSLSLAERTRQSMSMFSSANDNTSQESIKRRISMQPKYPANPFDTPRSHRTSLYVEERLTSGASTPKDKLFEEDAEYASVFKSRPRLATSPSLSPQRNDIVEDSILGSR